MKPLEEETEAFEELLEDCTAGKGPEYGKTKI